MSNTPGPDATDRSALTPFGFLGRREFSGAQNQDFLSPVSQLQQTNQQQQQSNQANDSRQDEEIQKNKTAIETIVPVIGAIQGQIQLINSAIVTIATRLREESALEESFQAQQEREALRVEQQQNRSNVESTIESSTASAISRPLQAIQSTVIPLFERIKRFLLYTFLGFITKPTIDFFTKENDDGKTQFQVLGDKAREFTNNIINVINDVIGNIENVVNTFIGGVNNVVNFVNDTFNGVVNAINSFKEKLRGIPFLRDIDALQPSTAPQIPTLENFSFLRIPNIPNPEENSQSQANTIINYGNNYNINLDNGGAFEESSNTRPSGIEFNPSPPGLGLNVSSSASYNFEPQNNFFNNENNFEPQNNLFNSENNIRQSNFNSQSFFNEEINYNSQMSFNDFNSQNNNYFNFNEQSGGRGALDGYTGFDPEASVKIPVESLGSNPNQEAIFTPPSAPVNLSRNFGAVPEGSPTVVMLDGGTNVNTSGQNARPAPNNNIPLIASGNNDNIYTAFSKGLYNVV